MVPQTRQTGGPVRSNLTPWVKIKGSDSAQEVAWKQRDQDWNEKLIGYIVYEEEKEDIKKNKQKTQSHLFFPFRCVYGLLCATGTVDKPGIQLSCPKPIPHLSGVSGRDSIYWMDELIGTRKRASHVPIWVPALLSALI